MSVDLSQTMPGIAALRAASKNAFTRFPTGNAQTAGWRMRQRAPVDVNVTPSFHLTRDDAVFTMGSCFARNVEDSLIRLGVNVLLADFDFPVQYFDKAHSRLEAYLNSPMRGFMIRSVLNKYTPHSMLNEFERILLPDTHTAPNNGLIEADRDLWIDPHVKNVRTTSLQDALHVREIVEEASRRVLKATAIFVTLGFTETWVDSETGIVLNVAPPPLLIRKWPDRFRFFNATHAQVLACLERLHAIVTAKLGPEVKFVATVSPVPLGATFTEMDIIAANAYSKATLRSAIQEFCMRHANVDYFPSYEMATSTHPDIAWDEDRVHVSVPLVDYIIGRFVSAYFTDEPGRAVSYPNSLGLLAAQG